MAQKNNNFPPTAFSFPSGIRTVNRDPRVSSGTSYYLLDSLSVDFRIQGFITDSTTNTHIYNYRKNGVKFIIDTATAVSGFTAISDQYDSNESTGFGDLAVGDVIVYNGADGAWELWFDASNIGISGASGGAFGYVVEEEKFYGYFGSVEGWDTVGVGGTGNTGNTGPAGLFGRKYSQVASAGDVNAAGELFIDNTLGGSSFRDLNVHRNGDGSLGDLVSIFYPNGVDAAYDDTNPIVYVSLYNETKNRTYAFRASAKAAAFISVSGYIDLDGDSANLNSFELVTSDSGAADWTLADAWSTGDEIYLVAVADGVNGVTGADGATGQGITYAGLDGGGEMLLQYLDANGNAIGSAFESGIVSGTDGTTGDPGEVGFLMAATGASATTLFWGNNVDGNTAEIQSGEIYYTIDDELGKLIAISYDSLEVTNDLIATHFGFSATEISNGTDYLKKPGSLYFYQELENKLVLKSFIKYTDARTTGWGGNPRAVILKGITDTLSNFSSSEDIERLGITLGAGLTKEIYVLPVVDGLKGVGITFGTIENNTLFLDYIDENGNTFGRFSSIEGITGPQGSLNPFNIPFTGITDTAGFADRNIQVIERVSAGGTAERLKVSFQSADNDDVSGYLKAPLESDSKSGFLSVFDTTDVANFGIFRFRDGEFNDTTNPKYAIYGKTDKPLIHVAGNITNIIDIVNDTKGFTVGERFLFALNTDGPRGFSGAVGIGFTYGNEYFATSISNKPQVRSDGNELEIGDKWYCLDAGLEFTYLGTSADTIVEVDTGGGSGDRTDIWVQTNNARQGKQGPKGESGTPGTEGSVGATGINDVGGWTTLPTYDSRDAAFVEFDLAYTAATSPDARNRITENWAALGSGVTNGYFTVKTSISSTDQIPGDFTIGGSSQSTRWNSITSHWSPVAVNKGGTQGAQGETGKTGASITDVIARPDGDYNVFLSVKTTDEDGGELTIPVQDGDDNDINFRGPTGPPGTIDATVNEFLVSNSSDGADGTNTIKLIQGKAQLQNYRELVSTSGTGFKGTNELDIDLDVAPVLHLKLTSDTTVDSVDLTNCDTLGDGVTLYVRKPSGVTVTWNANDRTKFKKDTVEFDEVYVSSQGFPTPGKIEFEGTDDECVGAFTFKMIQQFGTEGTILVVNYVSFVVPSAT